MNRPITAQQLEALASWVVSLRQGDPGWTKRAVFDVLLAATNGLSDHKTGDTVPGITDPDILSRGATRVALKQVGPDRIIKPDIIAMTGAHWENIHAPAAATGRPEPARCLNCTGVHREGDICFPPASQVAVIDADAAKARLRELREQREAADA